MVFQLSNVVSATVTSFIDYALIIVTIMIAWYVIKFFMAAPPTKEEREAALQGQREAWGGAMKKVKEGWEARNKEKEKKEYQLGLHNHSRTVIKNLRDALNASEKAIEAIDRGDSQRTIKAAKDLHKELSSAWGNLRFLRRNAKDEDKGKVQEITADIQANQHELAKVQGKIPRTVDNEWGRKTADVRRALETIHGSIGAIFNKINAF